MQRISELQSCTRPRVSKGIFYALYRQRTTGANGSGSNNVPFARVSPLLTRGLPQLGFLLFLVSCLVSPLFAQTTGGVKGKVRNSRGDGLAGATVTARQNSQDIKSATANSKGEFVLDGLEAGVYNFVIDAKGYAAAVRYNFEVQSRKVRSLGDALILYVDRGSLVIIQGSVFFKDGTSVAGAEVRIDRVESDGAVKNITTVYTNYAGEFSIRRPEGKAKYRFTAKFKDGSASREIEVETAAIYRTAISLPTTRDK